MRINIYFLFFICMPFWGQSQSAALSVLDGQYALHAAHTETGPDEIAPPRVFQPKIQQDGGVLLFRWERPAVSADTDVEYEFILTEGGRTFYSASTAMTELRLDRFLLPGLRYNKTYQVIVHTRISDAHTSFVLNGDKNAVVFTYLPECTAPYNVAMEMQGQSLILTWEGPLPSENAIRYEIEYFDLQDGIGVVNKKTAIVSNGVNRFEVGNLAPETNYTFRIRKLCDGNGAAFENASEWVELGPVNKGGVSQASVVCGGTVPVAGCPGTPAPENATFTQLFIRGFQIDVITISRVGARPGYWTGTGLMHLPFQNKKVKVQFTALSITNTGVICEGSALGMSDLPAYWPNFHPPMSPTNEICLPAGTQVGFDPNTGLWMPDSLPWNPQGFGADSQYIKQPPYDGYVPGAPFDTSGVYDPWGFDANCQNISTGTEFDLNGCSCYETDINGNPCQHTVPPYYWLNQNNPLGPPTQGGIVFANQQQSNITTITTQHLNTLDLHIQIEIDSIADACDSIRQIMRGLVIDLQYDSSFIFGPSGEYFEAGMHANFTAPPQPLGTHMDRDSRTIQLEHEHVHLYNCDLNGSKENNYKAVIDYFQTPGGRDSLVSVLLEMVKRFTPEEVTKYSNPDSLAAWVKLRVEEQIAAKYEEMFGASYGAVEHAWPDAGEWWAGRNKPLRSAPTSAWQTGNALALHGGDDLAHHPAFWQSMEVRQEDLAFEFAQGFKEIYGIDRGYFLEYIADERRKAELFPEYFTAHDSVLQPIELKKWVGGQYYYVYLDNIYVDIFPDPSSLDGVGGDATLDVYLLMDIPTLDQKIVLKALDVSFTPAGPVAVPIKLQLNNDLPLRMNNAVRVILKKSAQTHIKVDCDGFAGISLLGEVEVCRNYLTPLHPGTLEPLPEPERVSGNFSIQISHWSAFYATISFDRFAVTGYEDFKWVIDGVTFDFSDDISPTGLPPAGYSSPFAGPNGFTKAWQGIYIQNLEVHLPKKFNANNQTTAIGVERVLIDERGFSGTAKVTTPLISLGDGSAGGWAFSVDRFELTFIANQLTDGGFGGKINVPIISGAQCNPGATVTPEDCFAYGAKILVGNKYEMTVTIPQGQQYCADLWKAGTIIIDPNSKVQLTVAENGQFAAEAVLHGRITISAQVGNFDLSMPDTIRFQNLTVRNKAPYFSVGTWQMPSSINCAIGGFGLQIKNLAMAKAPGDDQYYLNFGIGISLTKEGSGEDSIGVSASANFKIYGELITPGGRQRWRFKEVQLSAISVDASFPGAKIKGDLAFYDDGNGTWGKGFRGLLDAKFEVINTQIKALAHFGRNSGSGGTFKYFFVDALVVLPAGIPVFPPLQIKGFGGGVYHHMSRAGSNPQGLPANPTPPPGMPPNLGVSLSGEQYLPDVTAGLGLKASVAVSIPKEQAFNANLSLEALFNSKANGGGLRSVKFEGIAFFMQDLKLNVAPVFNINDQAAVKAKAVIDVQFTPQFKLHGTLETYLKVGNVLEGVGPNGKVTDTEIHIEPGMWYINIGTPSDPQGLRLKLGGQTLAEMKMYMDIGKNIPPMPPLPAKVKALTGMGNFMTNESVRASGNGFAFGASVQVGSGEKKCVPGCNSPIYFYANILALAGFDLMLQNYGDATCSNLNNAPLGINGWYASGQAYMLMEASVGVGFKVFGIRKELEILGVGAAAAVQMKLPNPFWAKGAIGGKFSVMGGLVKGNINFGFTIGQSCQVSGGSNPSDDLQVISNLEPINGADQVDVAVHPAVTFSLPIGDTFEISDDNGTATFTTQLVYAKLTYQGASIPVQSVWQDDKTYLELIPIAMLPENDSVKLEVKVNIYKNSQLQTPEIKTAVFRTGSAYDEIPDFNVKAAYPVDGQYNFYPSEWMAQKGYVMLYANQPGLLEASAQNGRLVARVTSSSGQSFENPVSYLPAQARIEFPMPASQLPLQTVYRLQLIKKAQQMSSNNSNQNNNQSKGAGNPPLVLDPNDKVIYDAYFRTSQYPRFFDKVAAFSSQQGQSINAEWGSFKIPVTIEKFDAFEISGANGGDLITISAKLEQTNWFTSHVKPLIYNQYGGNQPGSYGIWVDERSPEPYGRIPDKAVLLESTEDGSALKVTADHFESGIAPTSTEQQYVYYLAPKVIYQDWRDVCKDVWDYIAESAIGMCCLQYDCCYYMPSPPPGYTCDEICDHYTNAQDYREYYIGYMLPTETLRNMYLNLGLNNPTPGTYPIEAKYQLPGMGNVTSTRSVDLQKN